MNRIWTRQQSINASKTKLQLTKQRKQSAIEDKKKQKQPSNTKTQKK